MGVHLETFVALAIILVLINNLRFPLLLLLSLLLHCAVSVIGLVAVDSAHK
jgi:hypothetical protein